MVGLVLLPFVVAVALVAVPLVALLLGTELSPANGLSQSASRSDLQAALTAAETFYDGHDSFDRVLGTEGIEVSDTALGFVTGVSGSAGR